MKERLCDLVSAGDAVHLSVDNSIRVGIVIEVGEDVFSYGYVDYNVAYTDTSDREHILDVTKAVYGATKSVHGHDVPTSDHKCAETHGIGRKMTFEEWWGVEDHIPVLPLDDDTYYALAKIFGDNDDARTEMNMLLDIARKRYPVECPDEAHGIECMCGTLVESCGCFSKPFDNPNCSIHNIPRMQKMP